MKDLGRVRKRCNLMEIERRMPTGFRKLAVEMGVREGRCGPEKQEEDQGIRRNSGYLTSWGRVSVQLSKENLFTENDYRLQLGELLFCPRPEERDSRVGE